MFLGGGEWGGASGWDRCGAFTVINADVRLQATHPPCSLRALLLCIALSQPRKVGSSTARISPRDKRALQGLGQAHVKGPSLQLRATRRILISGNKTTRLACPRQAAACPAGLNSFFHLSQKGMSNGLIVALNCIPIKTSA